MSDRSRRLVTSLVVVLLVAVAGCSTGYTAVSLEALADEQEAWDGRLVEVTGTVGSVDDPLHYWVEDGATHRVGLVPGEGLDAYVGRTVTVRGRFTFRDDEGRRILVDELRG